MGNLEITELATAEGTINRTRGTRLDQLQKAAKKSQEKYYMLIYDIPTDKNKECPNPSHILWYYDFRLNLSCWVLTEKSLESTGVKCLLQHWSNHKIETHIIPYSKEATDQIRTICEQKLNEELTRLHTSLITRLSDASDRYQEALAGLENPTEKQTLRVDQVHEAGVRAILKAIGESINGAISLAQYYDESMDTKALLDGLRQIYKAERETFNLKMAAKDAKLAE